VKKILIVDDEQSFLLSLKDGLKKHAEKFQVLMAENGRKAVEILRTTTVDLLVTDLKMPEMNGFELLAWVSRHKPQLPVIVMSAFGTTEIEARLESYDALQFLEKPLDLKVLEEGILNGLSAGGKSFIRGITLATFLQLMKAEQKNCTLKVTADGTPAFLYVSRGELIDAEFGDLSGLQAALEIVSWADSEIEMDGICRRQQDIINMPMEHLLIEAFKRKDEAVELEKSKHREAADTTNASQTQALGSDPLRKKIAVVLSRLAPIQEFVVFGVNHALESKSSGVNALVGLDPREIERLLNLMPESLNFGDFNFLVLNTANRHRYLLFHNGQRRILALLKPGTQAQQVIREIQRHLSA
jgi:DNA-binding response OmpR family regulator